MEAVAEAEQLLLASAEAAATAAADTGKQCAVAEARADAAGAAAARATETLSLLQGAVAARDSEIVHSLQGPSGSTLPAPMPAATHAPPPPALAGIATRVVDASSSTLKRASSLRLRLSQPPTGDKTPQEHADGVDSAALRDLRRAGVALRDAAAAIARTAAATIESSRALTGDSSE